ncbi:MAG: dihydroorotate dehydrogenase electron transfer subunit [Prevotella sp.]|nr:dihydroorotate dehydrogenase electron transfer subunit [Prevotella sp.]
MEKRCIDLTVRGTERLTAQHVLLRLTCAERLPEIRAGQFAEVRVDGSARTFLRRPFSINFVNRESNELWLLVHVVGDGTAALSRLKAGDRLNCILPLGNGFTPPAPGERLLLVGGGTGTAPLLFLGSAAKEAGAVPTFLIGAKTRADLLQTELLEQLGCVCITTEDGSAGERGMVTGHSILKEKPFDRIAVCGPKPMMMAVAKYAMDNGIDCEVSLENMMACGLGACLCCVEPTVDGNLCVCKDGPVFNVKKLLWQR